MLSDESQGRIVDFDTGWRTLRVMIDEGVFAPTTFATLMSRVLEARIAAGTRVCELGVGTGVLSILAGLKGAEVVGLDINEAAVMLAKRNWTINGLQESACDFRHSDRLSGLRAKDVGSFDVIFSNPPVLPDIGIVEGAEGSPARYEVNGPQGRDVLDAMLQDSGRYLKTGGAIYTIATSLQGWDRTQTMLARHWPRWSILDEREIPLTDECGPEYIAWWRCRQAATGEYHLGEGKGTPLHKLWFITAQKA